MRRYSTYMNSKTKKILLRLLLILFILVFIISAFKIIQTIYRGYNIKKESSNLVKKYIPKFDGTYTKIDKLDIDFNKLTTFNSDTIGWIQIPDTTLNYPIVHRKNDNETYLTHNFEKKYAPTGSIFLDGGNNPDLNDPATFIFGHNVSTTLTLGTETYFTCLGNFSNPEYLKKHPHTIIKTIHNKVLEYKNIGIITVPETTPLYKTSFKSKEEYISFQKSLADKMGLAASPFTENSKILILATCLLPQENITDRVLLIAYR